MTYKVLSDKATAYAQIVLSIVFIIGYFWVLAAFIEGRVKIASDWKETLQVLLGVLTANIGAIIGYWFSRHRTSEKPDA
jgi:uncharacterized protein YneF (UPF0154 family)